MVDNRLEELQEMQQSLIAAMKVELEKGVECVCTDEAGKVFDMIKDISEAIYYHSAAMKMMAEEPAPKAVTR